MPRVLIVEDNEVSRDMLARRLRKRGFEVLTAGDGQQALEQVHGGAPDIVLMDLGLPVLDGWEATRRLKADPATRACPVIALTAHAMRGDRDKALAAGADDYATKPVDFTALLAQMAALLDGEAP